MFHTTGLSTPTQTYRQPYSQSPSTPLSAHHAHYMPHHSPYGAMDTSYGPSTPITPDVASFPPSASTMPRAYVSPHLAAPFEHLALAGTPASTSSEYRVHPYECSPLEGGQGSVLSVKCEVNFPPSPPTSTFDGSASGQVSGMPPGRALRLVMGSYPVPTAVQVVPEQRAHSPGSQFCQLSATAPSWGAPGVAQMARGNRVPMYIQVLSEANLVLNSVLVGDFTYNNSASGSRRESRILGWTCILTRISGNRLPCLLFAYDAHQAGNGPDRRQIGARSSGTSPRSVGRVRVRVAGWLSRRAISHTRDAV